MFCLLQPKKKGPANPRSKGAWIKAEDQKVLSRLLLLLEMLESMTCSLLHVFVLQLKKAIEQHGMGSWQTISKYEVLDSFLRVFFQITSSRAVHFQGGSSADRRAMQGVMPKHLLLEPRQEERHFQRGLRPAITPTDVLFLPSAFFSLADGGQLA